VGQAEAASLHAWHESNTKWSLARKVSFDDWLSPSQRQGSRFKQLLSLLLAVMIQLVTVDAEQSATCSQI
jgi:hypothetical protein